MSAADPAAHHQLTDPAAAAPGAGCPDHRYQRSGSVPVVLAPDPAEDPAAHHQLTDPAADHPCLAPDPAALVAGRVEDPAAAV